MSKDNHWHDMALSLSKSAQRVYAEWLGRGLSPEEAYRLASVAYSDNTEYDKYKRRAMGR